MKILNNKSANIAGSRVICQHCGADLVIEETDPISLSKNGATVIMTTPYIYHNEDYLFVRKWSGKLYKVKCASCGSTIGFVQYGQDGMDEAVLINPKRYWVNHEEEGFYIVDIAKSIINHIHNDAEKYSYNYEYECHGDITDYITTTDNQKVPVYGESVEDILKEVQRIYPDITEDNQQFCDDISGLHMCNAYGGEGYVNKIDVEESCPGGIVSCNIRKENTYS